MTAKSTAQFFDSLTEKEIRRRQTLCAEQLNAACEQGNEKAIANLQRIERALIATMLRRC